MKTHKKANLAGGAAAALVAMLGLGSGGGCFPSSFSFTEGGDDGGDGSVGSDAGGGAPGDASTDAPADAPKSSDGGGACDLTKDFGVPELVRELSSPFEDGNVRFSNDGQVAYLHSKRRASGSATPWIYRSILSGGRWSEPQSVPELNIEGGTNFAPSPSPSGLDLVFESDRPINDGGADGRRHLWTAHRGSTSDPFIDLMNLTSVNTPGSEVCPYRLPNLHVIFYGIDRNIGRVDNNNSYQPQELLNPINAGAWNLCPIVTPDELTMYFGSTRESSVQPEYQAFDIWISHRAQKSDAWGTPTRVPNVNDATNHDIPNWLSEDGCTLYLQSSRPNGVGDTDIYVARRPK